MPDRFWADSNYYIELYHYKQPLKLSRVAMFPYSRPFLKPSIHIHPESNSAGHDID